MYGITVCKFTYIITLLDIVHPNRDQSLVKNLDQYFGNLC